MSKDSSYINYKSVMDIIKIYALVVLKIQNKLKFRVLDSGI